jgi:hypothetical protein
VASMSGHPCPSEDPEVREKIYRRPGETIRDGSGCNFVCGLRGSDTNLTHSNSHPRTSSYPWVFGWRCIDASHLFFVWLDSLLRLGSPDPYIHALGQCGYERSCSAGVGWDGMERTYRGAKLLWVGRRHRSRCERTTGAVGEHGHRRSPWLAYDTCGAYSWIATKLKVPPATDGRWRRSRERCNLITFFCSITGHHLS